MKRKNPCFFNTIRKKGSAHIEMVLSFVIFVGFTIFLFAIFSPFKSGDDNKVYLDNVARKITNNISTNIDFFTIVLNAEQSECYFIVPPSSYPVIAKDQNRNRINAQSRANKLTISPVTNNRIVYLYFFSEAVEIAPDPPCNINLKDNIDYVYGTSISYNYSAYNKILALNDSYNKDYASLKAFFGVPMGKNFAFSIRDSEYKDIIKAVPKITIRGEVSAKEYPLEVVNENGEIKYGLLNIQIW